MVKFGAEQRITHRKNGGKKMNELNLNVMKEVENERNSWSKKLSIEN